MNRIARFSAFFLAVASLLFVVRAPAQSPPAARSLAVATLAPSGSTWMRVLESWNRELRRRSGGALTMRFYANGVQGDEAEMVRKIRGGRLDGAAVTAVGLSQIHRPTLAFQLPGVFQNAEQLDRARNALRPELDAAYGAAGFELLGWGDAGLDRCFSSRAVLAPGDLAQTRPWLWSDDAVLPAFFEEAHVNPVTLQVPEVLTALQLHQVDTVFVSPIGLASLQWAQFITHMTDVPVAFEIGAIVFSKRVFDALPADQQALLRETGAQYTALLVRNVRRDDDATIPALRARGIAVDVPNAAQRAQWEAVFSATRTRLVGQLGDAAWIARIQSAAGR